MADAPTASDELYPIAVLIDELKVRCVPPSAVSLPAAGGDHSHVMSTNSHPPPSTSPAPPQY